MMNIKSMLVVTMFLVLPNIEVVSSAVLAVPLSAILERAEKAASQVETMMLELDKNEDLELTKEEFKPKWDAMASGLLKDVLKQLRKKPELSGLSDDEFLPLFFKDFDKDGNGKLDMTELKGIQKWLLG